MSRLWAMLRLCASLAPIGLLGHLLADALDAPAASLRCFNGTHAVLGLIALAGCAVVGISLYSGRYDARRGLALFFKALPGGGGSGTAALAAAFLTLFIACTQGSEGTLAAVSLLQALLVAAAVSICAVVCLAAVRAGADTVDGPSHVVRDLGCVLLRRRAGFARPYFAVVAVRGNRPPPFAP